MQRPAYRLQEPPYDFIETMYKKEDKTLFIYRKYQNSFNKDIDTLSINCE